MQTFNTQQWAIAFLRLQGNLSPHTNTVKFVIGWEEKEGGGQTNSCQFNALNTMQAGHGGTNCTNIGIKSYPTFADGVAANSEALNNGQYGSLRNALATNDENNLGFNGHAMAANVAGDLSVWVSGKRSPIAVSYIQDILKLAGESHPTVNQSPDQLVKDATNAVVPGAALLNKLTDLLNNPNRLAKGLIGLVLLLVGLALMIKQLVPPGVTKAATKLLAA
jgi:hypothetical protein